ncbi:PREDICTED: palmitoyltransferase ZDHHC2 [Chaetura pelagica]|uniref:palmitoyltransferase ZDHHC2 n=1 Tax=Chaetura pelagica TaxID=8897 RepID=UPI00052366C1|nr:PREDICTED: palmitoyltransferase ZDHHC2 [Chaetura pelagica]
MAAVCLPGCDYFVLSLPCGTLHDAFFQAQARFNQPAPSYSAARSDSSRLQKYYGPRLAFLILQQSFRHNSGAHAAAQPGFTTFHECFDINAFYPYYSYAIWLPVMTMTNIGEKVVCLVAYHIFFMLFVWSYWKTIFTLPMNPSKEFHLSYSDKESLEREPRGESQQEVLRRAAKDLPIYTRTMSGAIRYCDRCHLVKPDRCHHCSVCDKCILKMDHHCPWVNNCVGFSNYKFFLLFLAYSLLYCLFIAATDLQYFIRFWTNGLPDTQAKFHIMFLFFAAAMFSVSLSSLFGYHCWLVSKNKSTLEVFRAPIFRHRTDKNGFSLGFSKNLRQVFGDEKKYWLLPVFSSLGDGCSFPTCLVNQDPEQASTPGGLNSTSKNENHLFPAKPLRDSQSHLLTDTPSWSESSAKAEKGKIGMSNPALTLENET